jgi:carboxylesterase type B
VANSSSGFVKDGTYLKNRELVVNQTEASYVTDVPVMIGINRDEAGIDIDADKYPSDNITLAEYFDKVFTPRGLPADATKLLGLDKPANVSTYVGLPLPASMTTINSLLTPEQIIKTAVRIVSASVFNCYAMAQAVSGAKHKSFGASYFYTFNRTYGTNGYTRPWCSAPKTAARPNGDPDGEYMKCHASEMPLFFGTALRNGYPDRDGLDVPFMQLLIDYWAAYARTGDPNPPVEYLKVRGHAHTLSQVEKTGRWEPVDPEKPTQRWLQWNGGQRPFMEGPVCDMLGAPLDVFER